MSNLTNVHVEKSGPVWTVVLSRPERRNAVDRLTAEALVEAFEAFESDEDACVAVLYGDGGHFCAGADLKAFSEGRGNRIAADGSGPMGPTRLQLSKPTIAAIEGYAVAGGLELACWCDLRVMADTGTLGVFCRRFGIPLIDGGTVRLPRLIGESRALDLIVTGRPVAADEALAMGLVNRVAPAGTVLQAAQTLAAQIAAFPQPCLRSDRMNAITQWKKSETDALAAELHGAMPLLLQARAGAQRFVDGSGRQGKFE